jgi:hypothetical protein
MSFYYSVLKASRDDVLSKVLLVANPNKAKAAKMNFMY